MPNYGNSNLKVSDAITVAEVGGTPDAYPTHYAFLGKGGWRSAASLSALNSTSSQRLEAGCAGYVWNDGTSSNNGLYVWDGSAWVKTSLSPTAYSLPIASASVLGGVRIPSSGPISINGGNGDLSLRIATTGLTGIVRVGSGLAIDPSTGALSVTAADLTVLNFDGSYSQSYPKLRFTGSGITNIAEDSANDENIVTINAPTATVGGTAGAFTNIVFAASGGMSVGGSYNSGTKTYTVTYSITSSGTLKQNLSELDDVTITSPSNGQILQYNGSDWVNVAYTQGIALTSLSALGPLSYNSSTGVFSIPSANGTTDGYLSSGNWTTFNNKQTTITLTTTGTSGAATFNSGTGALNIPQYSGGGGGGGTVTTVAALTLGTTGTDLSSTVATSTTTPVITLNVPTASATNRGALSSTDWSTFNNKLNITAGTNAGSGASITLDFSVADTIYGSVGSAVNGNIGVTTTSGKVGVTHIVVHNSGTIPTITGALKLSGSGNYKPSVNNYIYFTYISGTTVIYSINQAS
jgi:hypothetical protein